MKTLTMESTIKLGRKASKKVSDLVEIEGKIFSLIKEGYCFDNEVLEAAHIKKYVRNVQTISCVRDNIPVDRVSENSAIENAKLPKDTASLTQILSELNTLTRTGGEINQDDYSSYNNQIDSASYEGAYNTENE